MASTIRWARTSIFVCYLSDSTDYETIESVKSEPKGARVVHRRSLRVSLRLFQRDREGFVRRTSVWSTRPPRLAPRHKDTSSPSIEDGMTVVSKYQPQFASPLDHVLCASPNCPRSRRYRPSNCSRIARRRRPCTCPTIPGRSPLHVIVVDIIQKHAHKLPALSPVQDLCVQICRVVIRRTMPSKRLVHSHGFSNRVVANRVALLLQSRLCLLYTSPSPRDAHESRMPSSA